MTKSALAVAARRERVISWRKKGIFVTAILYSYAFEAIGCELKSRVLFQVSPSNNLTASNGNEGQFIEENERLVLSLNESCGDSRETKTRTLRFSYS